jgi:hypothetical protein
MSFMLAQDARLRLLLSVQQAAIEFHARLTPMEHALLKLLLTEAGLPIPSELRFFRTICGWFSAVLSVRDELPTASVGRFVASADRPPPWTTLL